MPGLQVNSGLIMVNHKISVLIWLIVTFCAVTAQNEQFSFEHISIEQGLSQSSVTSICQDSRGFMWFGTYDGLNRYDGITFKVFKFQPDDSTSISHNGIISIFEDHKGNLWVGTYGGGLNLYNREKESFRRFKADPSDINSLGSDIVRHIFEDQDHNLWVGSWDGGLGLLDREIMRFKPFRHDPDNPNSLVDNRISCISQDKSGCLWIATAGGVSRFDYRNHSFTNYTHDPDNPNSISHNDIAAIHVDPGDDVWIGAWGYGLNRLNNQTGKITRYIKSVDRETGINHNIIRTINSVGPDKVLVGTWGGGLNIFNKKTETFRKIVSDPINPNSISGDFIYSIFTDKTDIMWIGTDFMGVNKYNQLRSSFIHYKYDPLNPNGLNNNSVTAILEDSRGIFWLGTAGGGLNRFNYDNASFSFFVHEPQNPITITNNVIKALCEDTGGNIWVATELGLNRLNPETGDIKRYFPNPDDPNSLSFHNIYSLYVDRKGDLWVGTYSGGLNKYNSKTDQFINYRHDPADPTSISDNYIWNIYEDTKGNFWIGTDNGGLNLFDRNTGKFTRFKNDPDNPHSISDNKAITIYEDKSGRLWIGTTAGLNRFDYGKRIFIKYKEKDGLPSNSVQCILEDDHGNLWISSNNGITKFDPDKKTFQNFNKSNGLQSNEFAVHSGYKAKDGMMLFGGINGFNIFHPDSIKINTHIPEIVITEFRLFNRDIPIDGDSAGTYTLEKSITETESITLAYRENTFSFEFAALDYSSPKDNQYACMMEGFDPKWNFIGNRNFAAYTNLSSGDYTFRVKASNNDGIWNEGGIGLNIKITPPFWGTLWFKIIGAVIVFGVILSGYKIRVNRIKKINRDLEKRVAQRTTQLEEINKELEAFTYSVSHDLRAPLRGLNGFSDILMQDYTKMLDDEGKDYLRRINHASKHMSALIEELLKLSRLSRNEMNVDKIDLGQICQTIADEYIRNNPERNAEIVIEKPLWIWADSGLIKIMMQNLIDNAWKFSSGKPVIKIEIGKQLENSETIIYVRDNGAGFPMDFAEKLFDAFQRYHTQFEGLGIGLATVKRIINRHGGRIWVESQEGAGSAFFFTLPDKAANNNSNTGRRLLSEKSRQIKQSLGRKYSQ